jgi:glucose-1-phosphate thymidylyltransferase
MKGIILAGGTGSRLFPATIAISKQLLAIYDKPLIYYPLSVLMLANIKDILIICRPNDRSAFETLLSDGSQLGIKITYANQDKPRGLADAFIVGKKFIGNNNVCLILGDNIFYGHDFTIQLNKAIKRKHGASVFCYPVSNPEEYGNLELNNNSNPISITEKPKKPKTNLAITGLYFFDKNVVKIAENIKPSKRGELEITDVIRAYLKKKTLHAELLGRGFAWLDTGTHESMLSAGKFVETIEQRQGFKIACIEEIALNNKWINKKKMKLAIKKNKNSNYGDYLSKIYNNFANNITSTYHNK